MAEIDAIGPSEAVREKPPEREAPEPAPAPEPDPAPPAWKEPDSYTPSPEIADTRAADEGPHESIPAADNRWADEGPHESFPAADNRWADEGAHEAPVPDLGTWLPEPAPEVVQLQDQLDQSSSGNWWQSAQNVAQQAQSLLQQAPEAVSQQLSSLQRQAEERMSQLEQAAGSGNPLAVHGVVDQWTGEALSWTGGRMHDAANLVDAADRANPYSEAMGTARINGMSVAALEFGGDLLQGVGSAAQYAGKVQQGDPEALSQARDVYTGLSYLEGRGYEAAGRAVSATGIPLVGEQLQQRGQQEMALASPEVAGSVERGLSAYGYVAGREQELKGQALQWVGDQTGLTPLSSAGARMAENGRTLGVNAGADEGTRAGVETLVGAGQEYLGRAAAQVPLQATQDLAATLQQGGPNPVVDALDARLNEYQERPQFAISRDGGRAALEIGSLFAGPEMLLGDAAHAAGAANVAARGVRETQAGLTLARDGRTAVTAARDAEAAVTAARDGQSAVSAARDAEAALTAARDADRGLTAAREAERAVVSPADDLLREAETPLVRALDPREAVTPPAGPDLKSLLRDSFADPEIPRFDPRTVAPPPEGSVIAPARYGPLSEVVERRLGAAEGKNILELGPFDNTDLARQLGERNRYLAGEMNPSAATRLQKGLDEAGGLGNAVISDTYHLPFADESMDSVIALNHNPFFRASPEDKIAALDEVARVLKPNGEFILEPWMRDVNPPEVEQALRSRFDLLERTNVESVGNVERDILVLRKPGVPTVEPTSVSRPPDVRPDDLKLNADASYQMEIPGMGRVMAKSDAGQHTRTQGEVLASLVDGRLPRAPGGADRIVPETVPIRLAEPTQGAPAGVYSAQRWVDGAEEFAALQSSGRAADTFLPDDVRMRYLDVLTGTVDRHPGNWLVDANQGVHAIDNGYVAPLDVQGARPRVDPRLGDYLTDVYMGRRTFQGVSQGAERPFLEQSLEYARRAQTELTDQAIDQMVDQLARYYPDKDLTGYAELLRHNRDGIPALLERQLTGP